MSLDFVGIFGMGRMGRTLADELQRLRIPVCIGGRGSPSRGSTLNLHKGPADFLSQVPVGGLVILSVRDDAIAEVAARFAGLPGGEQRMFVHTSGASGPAALKPLADAGAQTGVFHILQSLPPASGRRHIAGSYAAITGTPGLLPALRKLASRLELHPVELADQQWVPYHAAAVLASNALLGLLDTGRSILKDAGIAEDDAGKMLLPLVMGTLKNVQEHDLATALTGPVVRGDVGTIQRHLAVLEGEARTAYKSVIRSVIGLAERTGRTPEARLDEIRELISR